MIIINVKSFLERHFWGISINSFRKQMCFYEKCCTVYNHSDALARQVLRDLFSTNQRSDWQMTFVAGTNDWMTCCRKQSEDISYI